jgi:SAM-dependent methyltransferase
VSSHGHSPDPAGPEANVNYRFLREYVRNHTARDGDARVLDYGCGAGGLVTLLRDDGADAYGADVFYEGADYSDDPGFAPLLAGGFVREIDSGGRIPFEDGHFDLVVSNQVFEHVEHLEAVIAEVDRVLAPGGTVYHHFPSREVWREAHIGIPFAHRMPAGRLRDTYTLGLRRLGFGFHDDQGLTPREWTADKLEWIDTYCFYRPYAELERAFTEAGYEITHREIDYCRFRAEGRPLLERVINTPALSTPIERTFRRVAFMALELRRTGSGARRPAVT